MKTLKRAGKAVITEYKVIIIVMILGIALAMMSPVFLTQKNILNVLRQVSVNAIVASAFVIILGTGGIDLSVGSCVGLVGVVGAMLLTNGVPIIPACLIAILFGAFLGAINAFFITRFNLLPFVVTLSTQQIFRGFIYLFTDMKPISGLPDGILTLGQGRVGNVPVPIFIMLGMAILMWIVSNRTKFGRYTLAIGGNVEATRVSGVDVKKTMGGAYILMGACSALAGLVLMSRTASAQITAGTNMEMDIIAGCVIGGTPLTGGISNVFGSVVGCLMVGIVSNGLNLLGIDPNWQTVMKGALILIAVLIDTVSSSVFAKKRRV